MKNKLMTVLCLGLATFGLNACIGSGQNTDINYKQGNGFPTITGIDLHGNEREIPTSLDGTYKIITVAFERKQQDLVDTWLPFIEGIESSRADVSFYEVPIIYEMSGMGRFWVNNGMRAGIKDGDARNRTITVYTERDSLANHMDLDMSTITTFVLDANGAILWKGSGAYSPAYNDPIMEVINQ